MACNAQPLELLSGHGGPEVIAVRVEHRPDLQTAPRPCVADEIHDGLVARQWLPLPTQADEREQRCSILFHLLVPGG
jgi:hypothetical protein